MHSTFFMAFIVMFSSFIKIYHLSCCEYKKISHHSFKILSRVTTSCDWFGVNFPKNHQHIQFIVISCHQFKKSIPVFSPLFRSNHRSCPKYFHFFLECSGANTSPLLESNLPNSNKSFLSFFSCTNTSFPSPQLNLLWHIFRFLDHFYWFTNINFNNNHTLFPISSYHWRVEFTETIWLELAFICFVCEFLL